MTSRPLSQWLALTVVAVIFITGLISYLFIDHLLGAVATDRINSRARGVMETMLAVRQYAAEKTTPLIEPINFQQSQHFWAESVPSYSAKTVFAAMQAMPHFRGLRYREAVLYPTNPQDLPTDLESAIIQRFKSDGRLMEVSGDDLNPLSPFHYIARPLTVTDSSCLRCHGIPVQAPQSMINVYGSRNGFGWKVGETIGAQVVKVPMDEILELKQELLHKLMFLIVAGLVSLAAVMFIGLHHLLVRPLSRFASIADSASQAPNSVSFPQTGAVEELNRLQRSLERLRVSLLVAMNLAQKP